MKDRITRKITASTNASQTWEGTYENGVTKEEIERLCQGSWGGRLAFFENGKFKYIAYTD